MSDTALPAGAPAVAAAPLAPAPAATAAAAPLAAAPVAPAQPTPATAAHLPAAPTPAAPAAAPAQADDKEPHWLSGRLDRAKKELLKELGVEDVKDAKAALAAFKADQEAKKSDLQKAQERAASLETAAKERDLYKTHVEASSKASLAALTEAQRAAVTRLAGDDPLRIADAIDVLRPTWAAAAPAGTTGAPAPVAPPPPAPAPANTAPPAGAPPPATQRTKHDEYTALKNEGKRQAADLFYQVNKLEIERTRPAA